MGSSVETSSQSSAGTGDIGLSFEGTMQQFTQRLLETQCRVAAADFGFIIGADSEKKLSIRHCHPTTQPAPQEAPWMQQVMEVVTRSVNQTIVELAPLRMGNEMYGVDTGRYIIVIPLKLQSSELAAAAFIINKQSRTQAQHLAEYLALSANLWQMFESRETAAKQDKVLIQLKRAYQTLSGLNAQTRYKAAAMALCNAVAEAWLADRVSLGSVKPRGVKLQAMSHVDRFSRNMEVVQVVEAAMEECSDQNEEVIFPPAEQSISVHRAAADLSQRFGPSVVLTLPLRLSDEPVAALTIERPADQPFDIDELESLRLTCNLCTPRLLELQKNDRWFGAKWASSCHDALGFLIGPTHTWAKLAAVAVLGLILFLVMVKGTYRVESPFLVQPVRRQMIVAPFDGYLSTVDVRPGDKVVANQTVLAKLDTSELELKLSQARADLNEYQKEALIARRENKIAEEQIAQAQGQQVQAKIDLLSWQIKQASLRSPISGAVIAGDLQKELGAAVTQGKQLFEVAPLDNLRADLLVPEDRIQDLLTWKKDKPLGGTLATASHPGDYLKFEIERIDPIAEVVNQQNIFRVRVRLLETRPWLRPGMEGVAKIDLDERTYGQLWTGDVIKWLRMKLWL